MNTAQTKLEKRKRLFVVLLLLFPSIASAFQFHVSHSDPIAPVILGVTGILFFALMGRFGARKLEGTTEFDSRVDRLLETAARLEIDAPAGSGK